MGKKARKKSKAAEESKDEKIGRIYHDPSTPGGYAGFSALYREVRQKFPDVSKKDVQNFLEGDRTYTLFKPRRLKFPRSKTIPLGYMTTLQVDLADFQQIADENGGYRYLLVAVDVLSRMVFAVPIKSKGTNDMKRAFDELFAQMPQLPSECFSDLGKEFESNEMHKYFEEKGIKKVATRTGDTKAAVAERFIRTIKDRIYRYFSAKNTIKWVEVVPQILNAMNNTPNIATGIAPNKIKPSMTRELWDRLYREHMVLSKKGILKGTRKPRYETGDAVRLLKAKRTFDKSYWPRFTDEVFTVDRPIRAKPNFYLLKDHEGEEILGRVYEPELSKTKHETSYRIEEIFGERTHRGEKQIQVKFIGYKKLYWIPKKDLIQ